MTGNRGKPFLAKWTIAFVTQKDLNKERWVNVIGELSTYLFPSGRIVNEALWEGNLETLAKSDQESDVRSS